jgi:hypothetical protein
MSAFSNAMVNSRQLIEGVVSGRAKHRGGLLQGIIDRLVKAGYPEARVRSSSFIKDGAVVVEPCAYVELVVNRVEFTITPAYNTRSVHVRVMPLIGAPSHLMWTKYVTFGNVQDFVHWFEEVFEDYARQLSATAEEIKAS